MTALLVKLFEGCWHSSHSYCLQKNLQSLAKTANEAFVKRSQEDPNDDYKEDADVTEEGNTNSDDDHEIHVVGEVNLDEILQHLTRQIFSLHVLQPSANRPAVNQNRSTSQLTSVRKPPHCSLCGHKRQGYHKETSITGERVINWINCSNQICCQGGGGALCSCSWYSPCNFYFSSISLGGRGTLQTAPYTPHVVFQNQGDVTEWVLSVLVAIDFLLLSGWVLLSPKISLCQAFVSTFKEIMAQGNILHQWLGCLNLNFSAQEVIQYPVLGVSTVARGGDKYQFTSFQQFAVELPTIVTSQQRKHAAVIILPLNNSMLVLIEEAALTATDSP